MSSRRFAPLLIAGSLLLAGCDGEEESAEKNTEARTEVRKGRDGLYLQLGDQAQAGNIFHQFLLGPGDRIVRDPDGGVDPFDAARADPKNVGTYRLDGAERMTIQWGDGTPVQTFPVLTLNGGQIFKFDGQLLPKAHSYQPGAKVTAIYAGVFGFTGEQTGNLRVTGRAIVFVEDGRFETAIASDADGENREEGSLLAGTYKLAGNTLTLRFADGRETRHTVVPIGHDNNQPYIPDLARAKNRYEWLFFDRMRLRRTR